MQISGQSGLFLGAVLVWLLASGCGELDDILEVPRAAGSIHGEVFSFQSGTAEATSSGYTLTLTDSSSYGCDRTPASSYLTVVAVDISEVGRISAVGNVTFNRMDSEVGALPEGATSGSVSIDRIDEEALVIEGYIDVFNAESNVQGDFAVPICP